MRTTEHWLRPRLRRTLGPAKNRLIDSQGFLRVQRALIAAAVEPAVQRRRPNSTDGPRTVIVAPCGGLNVGDQAMLEAAVAHSSTPSLVIVPATGYHLESLPRGTATAALSGVFTPLHPRRLAHLSLLAGSLSQGDALWLLGADVMDGGYSGAEAVGFWDLAASAAESGVDVRVVGFSWGADRPQVVAAARRALTKGVRAMVRDPMSARRFRGLGLECVETADPVFAHPGLSEIGERARRGGGAKSTGGTAARDYVIVNVSGYLHRIRDQLPAGRRIVDAVLAQGFAVRIVPSSASPGASDEPLCAALAKYFQTDERVALVPRIPATDEAGRMAAEASLVVTGRMHLGIIGLSVGTPALIVETQGKVAGLAEQFDQPDFCIGPDEPMPETMLERLTVVLSGDGEPAARTRTRLADVAASSLRNFGP